jgi:PIN domain nuclease of toxin-antitoxin system
VRYLLDTHVWIWSQESPDRLGRNTRQTLAEVDQERLISPISTLEIAAEAYDLPGNFHKDPIDRVLVATARIERLTLVTADDLILRYAHVKTLRADR